MKKALSEITLRAMIDDYLVDRDAGRVAANFATTPYNLRVHLRTRRAKRFLIERRAKLQTRLFITAERVLNEKAKVAFANMASFTRLTRDGYRVIDLSDVDDMDMAAIQEITTEEDIIDDGSDGGPVRRLRRTRLRLHDKNSALNDLMRHLGILEKGRVGVLDTDYEVTMDLAATSSAMTLPTLTPEPVREDD